MSDMENQAQTIKKTLYVAIGIAILVLFVIFIFLPFILLISNFASKTFGVGGVCPYSYSSFGLFGLEAQKPMLYTLSELIMKVVYSVDANGVASGVLSNYRNALLENRAFQTIRILLVVLNMAILGLGFAFGFTSLKSSDIMKRLGVLLVFLWATDSNTYDFYDTLIGPLILNGYRALLDILNTSLAGTFEVPELNQYILDHSYNEFSFLDAVLTSIFSKTIFVKLMSLSMINVVEWGSPTMLIVAPITAIAVYSVGCYLAFLFIKLAIDITFYKLIIVIGLSLFPIFMLFFSVKVIGGAVDKFSEFFSNYAKEMLLKPSASIVVIIFSASLIATLMLQFFFGAFNYEICVYMRYNFLGFAKFYHLQPIPPSSDAHFVGSFFIPKEDILKSPSSWSKLFLMSLNTFFVIFLAVIFKHAMPMIKNIIHGIIAGFSGQNAFSSLSSQAFKAAKSYAGKKIPNNLKEASNQLRSAVDTGIQDLKDTPEKMVNKLASRFSKKFKYPSDKDDPQDTLKDKPNLKKSPISDDQLDPDTTLSDDVPNNPSSSEITDNSNNTDNIDNTNNTDNTDNTDNEDNTDKLKNSSPPPSQETEDMPDKPNITREEIPSSNSNIPEAEIDVPSDTSPPPPIDDSLEHEPNMVTEPEIEGAIPSENEIGDNSFRTIPNDEPENNNPTNPDPITIPREGIELPEDSHDNNINPQPESQTLPDSSTIESENKINEDSSPPVNDEKEIDPKVKDEPKVEEPSIDKPFENTAEDKDKIPQINDWPIDTKPLHAEEVQYPNLPQEPEINPEPTFVVENPIDNQIDTPIDNQIENPIDNQIENPIDNQIDKPFNDSANTDPQPNVTDVEKIAEVSKKVEDRMELIEQIQDIKTGGGEPNSTSNSPDSNYNSISIPTTPDTQIDTSNEELIAPKHTQEENIVYNNNNTNNSQPTKSVKAKKPAKNFLEYNKMNVKQNAAKNSNSLKNPNNKK